MIVPTSAAVIAVLLFIVTWVAFFLVCGVGGGAK